MKDRIRTLEQEIAVLNQKVSELTLANKDLQHRVEILEHDCRTLGRAVQELEEEYC